jgi:hypothetical protein
MRAKKDAVSAAMMAAAAAAQYRSQRYAISAPQDILNPRLTAAAA